MSFDFSEDFLDMDTLASKSPDSHTLNQLDPTDDATSVPQLQSEERENLLRRFEALRQRREHEAQRRRDDMKTTLANQLSVHPSLTINQDLVCRDPNKTDAFHMTTLQDTLASAYSEDSSSSGHPVPKPMGRPIERTILSEHDEQMRDSPAQESIVDPQQEHFEKHCVRGWLKFHRSGESDTSLKRYFASKHKENKEMELEGVRMFAGAIQSLRASELPDAILAEWDGPAGDPSDMDKIKCSIQIPRFIVLTSPLEGVPDAVALMSDTLATALVRATQKRFINNTVLDSAGFLTCAAEALGSLYSTGYTEENLEHFIKAADNDPDNQFKTKDPMHLRSRREGGLRAFDVTIMPSLEWTPLDCKHYQLSDMDKLHTREILLDLDRGSEIPVHWPQN